MDNNYDQDMDLLTSQEEADWERFLKVFSKKNEPPVLQESNLSWRFYLILLGAVGSFAFSAFRNSGAFFQLASRAGAEPWAVWGETISGIGAVNILLVCLSLLIAYKARRISDFSLYAGAGIVLAIGSFIGLSQAFTGLGITGAAIDVTNFCLALLVAIGIPCLEWLGGDLLGVELVRHELEVAENKLLFVEKDDEWAANARKQFSGWVMRKTNKRTSLKSEPMQQSVSNKRTSTKQTPTQQTNSSGEQTIRTYLDTVFANEQRVLGVSELARLMITNEHPEFTNEQSEEFVRRTKGYISQVRARWIGEKDKEAKVL